VHREVLETIPPKVEYSLTELGADVAFCLRGGTALATGIGEKVEALPALDIGPVLIVKPKGPLPSGIVYDKFDGLGVKSALGADDILNAVRAGDRRALISALANDLEPAAISLLPEIGRIKVKAAAAGAAACMVSGSGPAMFVIDDGEDRLGRIAESLAPWARTWLTRPVDHGVEVVPDAHETRAAIL